MSFTSCWISATLQRNISFILASFFRLNESKQALVLMKSIWEGEEHIQIIYKLIEKLPQRVHKPLSLWPIVGESPEAAYMRSQSYTFSPMIPTPITQHF